MLQKTIEELEVRLRTTPQDDPASVELLRLLDQLKREVEELAKTHAEEARSIEGFTAVSAHEATRANPDPTLMKLSLDGLAHSVGQFEQTHPKMVQAVNAVCHTLSSLGI